MKIREYYNEVLLGVDARLKLVQINLTLRALGFEATGDVVADVKAALVQEMARTR